MKPENNNPASYLDQIAPVQQKTGLMNGNFMKVIIFGITSVVLVVIVALVVNLGGGSKTDTWTKLHSEIATTKGIIDNGKKNIKNNKLRSINSEVSIFIVNIERDVAENIKAPQIDSKKLGNYIAKDTKLPTALSKLEDARLNAAYDGAYTREMTFQLSHLLLSIQKAHKSLSSENDKKLLEKSFDSIKIGYDSLVNFEKPNQ